MIDKLQELILHFEDLEKQMIDPNLINDQNKYKEVTREHRRLIPIIDKSKQYIYQFIIKSAKMNLYLKARMKN